MKKILIINGSGGVGKDTFVNFLKEYIPTIHTSIVEPVKELAEQVGWNGGKTEKDRKFLYELKHLIDEYSDYNYQAIKEVVDGFKSDPFYPDGSILCIDMREKEQILRAKKDFGAETVLITRDSVEKIKTNAADAGVFDIEYDYKIENNGTLEELRQKAKEFVTAIKTKKAKKKYTHFASLPLFPLFYHLLGTGIQFPLFFDEEDCE